MSADNFLAIIKEGKGKWVGYHCCASHPYLFNDCYGCLGRKEFETTTELKALHEAQQVEERIYLEYGFIFPRSHWSHWLTSNQTKKQCPCELKRFITEVK